MLPTKRPGNALTAAMTRSLPARVSPGTAPSALMHAPAIPMRSMTPTTARRVANGRVKPVPFAEPLMGVEDEDAVESLAQSRAIEDRLRILHQATSSMKLRRLPAPMSRLSSSRRSA